MDDSTKSDKQLVAARTSRRGLNWSTIFGYDFFISYRRSDATGYASALASELKKADFRCFLDDESAVAGDILKERLLAALRRSRKLIVIASPELAKSTWVPVEVEAFLGTGRDIISINIQNGLDIAAASNSGYAPLLSRLWIDELPAKGPKDLPSDHVIGNLIKNFADRRANRTLRMVLGFIGALILALAAFSYWQRAIAIDRLVTVQSQAIAADARRQVITEPYAALATSVRAFDIQPSLEAQAALLEALSRVRRVKRYLPCPDGQKANGVAFSPDGTHIATACAEVGGQTTITVQELGGKNSFSVSVGGDARDPTFTDATHLKLGQDGKFGLLDINSQVVTPTAPLPSAQGPTQQELQDMLPTDCLGAYPNAKRYSEIAISPRGYVAYATDMNEIIIKQDGVNDCQVLSAHTHNILAMAWSPDASYFASAGAIEDGDSRHGTILWDLSSSGSLATVLAAGRTELSPDLTQIALTQDGKTWICAMCGSGALWNNQDVPLPDDVNPYAVTSLAIDSTGSIAIMGIDDGRVVTITRTGNNFASRTQQLSKVRIEKLFFYQNGEWAAVDGNGQAWLASVGGIPKTSGEPQEMACYDLASGPSLISDVPAAGKLHALQVTSLDTNHHRLLANVLDTNICGSISYDTRTGSAIRTSASFLPVLITPASPRDEVGLMENPLRDPDGLPTILKHAAVATKASRIVVSSNENSLAIFDLTEKQLVGAYDLPGIRSLAVSDDGNTLLSSADDGVVSLDLNPEHWRAAAIDILGK
ncbi:TIR domain-containing protein [Rhizobium tubonense]|uniref:TIR domain-containing protein n=1 Tax=Rhizobium tubonense TaxID=484088 RepID=A0A2W4C9P0_9HYPH|nr:TIR domain-containing protein [Rhizobium tubonense]PZM08078.1 hypothetical protein CPY51_30510 [Rhizobium tubonense]